MLIPFKQQKNLIIPIIISICLLLWRATGIIEVKMNNNQTPSLWYHPDTEQRLKRFASHESNTRTIKDIMPMSWELLVSPDYSRHLRKKTMQGTKDSLSIWLYNITHEESRTLIKDLARKWTQVRMILEDDKFGTDEAQDPRWWWIQVRNDAKLHTNFVHAKTFVTSGFYIIQTANLTNSARTRQREYYIIGHNPQIIANLQMLFDKDRNGHRIDPQDIHPNLVFCEVDCRHKVTELISSAKESIIIQNQYVEDEEIIWLLSDKINAGIDTRINLPQDEGDRAKDLPFLDNHVKFLNSPRIHAKALLIDNTYLLISSINLSSNSLDNNREIGIIITDTQTIASFLKQFNEDWKNSK